MHAHNGSHMVVLPLLQRRWSLRGREVFGILSPSHQACEVIFNVFMEMNCLFSITPKTKLKRMRSHVDAGLDSVRCWAHVRWVQRSKTQMAMRVGASYSLASVRQILCWRSLMLTFNRQLIMEKDPIQLTPRLRVLSDRIPRVLVFVYFYRGVIRKYGEKAHTSGLHRDINVPRNFLSSRGLQKPRERSGGRTGPRPGRPPTFCAQSESFSGSCSTDLRDQGKPCD